MGVAGGSRNLVFVGIALGMLVAVTSQTIVSPAMPVIVADLGGIEHYGWIASSALLTAAVSVPIVGKLSDVYGRRGFYIAGLVVFMVGSVFAAMAPTFQWLVAARAVQGFGMGAIQTLSLTILGEIVSPRERGKYMGYLGALFGVALVAGPVAGGWIADSLSWRWLFYANLPIGVAALAFVAIFLRLPQVRSKRTLDYAGFLTLGLGLCSLLLATTWGGTRYPWGSWQIVTLFVASAALLAGFVINERRAKDPVLPPRLWRDPIFALSNVSNMAVGMAMYGAVFFVPLYARGVVGVSVRDSGTILVPLLPSAVAVSIIVGRLITHTGRYKGFVLAGLLILMVGYLLLGGLEYGSTRANLTFATIGVGVGLGAVMQTYTLVVQNAASRADLGIATSATQLSRSMGATFGPAVFGAVMAGRMETEIPKHLPPVASDGPLARQLSGGAGVGSLLEPGALGGLPPAVAAGVREGLAAAMHSAFLVGLPVVAVALVASVFIRELPLRETAFVDEDARTLDLDGSDRRTVNGARNSNRRDERRKP